MSFHRRRLIRGRRHSTFTFTPHFPFFRLPIFRLAPTLRLHQNRHYKVKHMIELEVYAAGVRNLEKILELDHELEAVAGLRYKVDSNHDIVYLDFDEPTLTIQEVRSIFRKLGLEPRIVGPVPAELNPKSKTQPLRV